MNKQLVFLKQPSAISYQLRLKFIIFKISLLILTSCYTLIDPKLPQLENIPVANAILQQGHPMQIQLTHSAKPDTTAINAINNAQVRLFVNGVFAEELSYMGKTFYEGTTIVEAGKKYLCEIVIPGADTLTCEDEIPLPEEIFDIKHINIAGKDEEGTSYPALQVRFSNNLNTLNYYEIQTYLLAYDNDILYPNILNVVDPVLLNEGLPILLFSNEAIIDSFYTMYINYNTGMSGGSVAFRTILFPFIVELRTVSYNYYRFRKQYYLYEQGRYADGVIETMTSAPLFSNIENGMGIFAGYSSILSDTIFPAYER